MKVKIRRAIYSDLKQIYNIEKTSFKYPYPYRLFLFYLNLFPDLFLVMELESKIIGYCISIIEKKHIGHIISIAILPEYRRKGSGKLLLNEAISKLMEKNVKIIKLEVSESNIPAIKMYEKLGFIKVDKIEHYYPDGSSCWIMIKEIKHEN